MTSLELLNHRNELIGRVNEQIERQLSPDQAMLLIESVNDLICEYFPEIPLSE